MTNTAVTIEIDCTTGESVERTLTPAEIAQREIDAIAYAAQQQAEADAAIARAAIRASAINKLVAGQPLTAEEADLFVVA